MTMQGSSPPVRHQEHPAAHLQFGWSYMSLFVCVLRRMQAGFGSARVCAALDMMLSVVPLSSATCTELHTAVTMWQCCKSADTARTSPVSLWSYNLYRSWCQQLQPCKIQHCSKCSAGAQHLQRRHRLQRKSRHQRQCTWQLQQPAGAHQQTACSAAACGG